MDELLPGAEYAPVIAWEPRSGHRLATPEEIAAFNEHRAIWSDFGLDTGSAAIRCLSCSDPLDMRAIWYWAALHFGYEPDVAMSACLRLQTHPEDPRVAGWALTVEMNYSTDAREWLWSAPDEVVGAEEATVALCLAVWGPK